MSHFSTGGKKSLKTKKFSLSLTLSYLGGGAYFTPPPVFLQYCPNGNSYCNEFWLLLVSIYLKHFELFLKQFQWKLLP